MYIQTHTWNMDTCFSTNQHIVTKSMLNHSTCSLPSPLPSQVLEESHSSVQPLHVHSAHRSSWSVGSPVGERGREGREEEGGAGGGGGNGEQ